jgi:hypothetical protein
LLKGADVSLEGRLGIRDCVAAARPVAHGGVGEVGVHSVGPVAEQRADVVHRTGLAALQHERRVRPAPRPNQIVMHGPHDEKARRRTAVWPCRSVREVENFVARLHGLARVPPNAFDRRRQGRLRLERRVNRRRLDAVRVNVVEGLQLRVAEDGRIKMDLPTVVRSLRQQVPFVPDVAFERGDQLFADVVEGWV